MTADRVIATFSTYLLADGRSQRDFLIAKKVVRGESCTVLRQGSISGVDQKRFRPDPDARRLIRTDLEIPEDAVVVIFVGRVNRDKGVVDLAEALALLQTKSTVHSVWVGSDEEGLVPVLRGTMAASGHSSHFVGFTEAPERFLAAADVLCLPSYREGFGTSVIEAAAAGLPAVVSDIYGLADAVVKGETGVVFPVGNYRELSACLTLMIDHPSVREKLARAARARAREFFRQEDIVQQFRHVLADQILQAKELG
jgi:glycosyltransferase involved in cell wall biosynthesis